MNEKLMHLCPSCADNLKSIRNVVVYKVTVKKETCEECGRQRYCDEYIVRGGGKDNGV